MNKISVKKVLAAEIVFQTYEINKTHFQNIRNHV